MIPSSNLTPEDPAEFSNTGAGEGPHVAHPSIVITQGHTSWGHQHVLAALGHVVGVFFLVVLDVRHGDGFEKYSPGRIACPVTVEGLDVNLILCPRTQILQDVRRRR